MPLQRTPTHTFNIYLNGLDNSVTANESTSFLEPPEPVYVEAALNLPPSLLSRFSEQWLIGMPQGTESNVVADYDHGDLIFFMNPTSTLPSYFYDLSGSEIINSVDFTDSIVSGDDDIIDDWLKALANQIFGNPDAAVLFTNAGAIKTSIKQTIGQSIKNILEAEKTKPAYSDGIAGYNSTSNFGRKLFTAIAVHDPDTLNGLTSTQPFDTRNIQRPSGVVPYNTYKLPIMAGDTISFKVTVAPDSAQMNAIWLPGNGGTIDPMEPISYLINATFTAPAAVIPPPP